MAIGFSLFRTKKPRRFQYQPKYYDARKEALQQQVQATRKAVEMNKRLDEEYGERHAENIRLGYQTLYRSRLRREKRKANLRVAAILAILISLFYLYLKN